MYRIYCDDHLIYDTRIEQLTVLNPRVELELNKTGTASFSVLPSHPYFASLKKMKSIIKVLDDEYVLFRGRILNDEKGFFNEKSVICEGELAFLLDSIQRPYEFTGTPAELFTQLINSHNSQVEAEHEFKVGNVTVTDPNDYILRSDTQYLNTWDSIAQKLVGTLGGYLWVRHEADGNYIDYLADFNTLNTQSVTFGKNLTDILQKSSGQDIATAVIPLGASVTDEISGTTQRIGIRSVNNDVDYVFNQTGVDMYGWIFRPVVWDDVTEPSNLLTKGQAYVDSAVNPLSSIEIDAVDVSFVSGAVNSFRTGSYIKVESAPHGLNQTFLISKLSIDLTNPANNKLTVGSTFRSMTDNQLTSANAIKNIDVTGDFVTLPTLETAISEANQNTEDATNALANIVANSYTTKGTFQALADKLTSTITSVETHGTDITTIQSMITQTNTSLQQNYTTLNQYIETLSGETQTKFNEIKSYIDMGVEAGTGLPYISLGASSSPFKVKITNDKISFLQDNVEVAYITGKQLYIKNGVFLQSIIVGDTVKFAWTPRSNGNLSFGKLS